MAEARTTGMLTAVTGAWILFLESTAIPAHSVWTFCRLLIAWMVAVPWLILAEPRLLAVLYFPPACRLMLSAPVFVSLLRERSAVLVIPCGRVIAGDWELAPRKSALISALVSCLWQASLLLTAAGCVLAKVTLEPWDE